MVHRLIPNILHFMPGCSTHIDRWRDAHPEFLCLVWDDEAVARLEFDIDRAVLERSGDPCLVKMLHVLYHFGGVVVGSPLPNRDSVATLLESYTMCRLMIVRSDVAGQVDTRFMAASARSNDLRSLFNQWAMRRDQVDVHRTVLDMANTAHTAVSHAPPFLERVFEMIDDQPSPQNHARPSVLDSDILDTIRLIPPTARRVLATTPGTEFENAARSYLQSLDHHLVTNNADVIIVDTPDGSFDFANPVPGAVLMSTTFHKHISTSPECSFALVNHSPRHVIDGGDMMIARRLSITAATLLHRGGACALWRLT